MGMNRSIQDISRTEFAELYDRHASELQHSENKALDLARYACIARLSTDARAYMSGWLAWWAAANE